MRLIKPLTGETEKRLIWESQEREEGARRRQTAVQDRAPDNDCLCNTTHWKPADEETPSFHMHIISLALSTDIGTQVKATRKQYCIELSSEIGAKNSISLNELRLLLELQLLP